MTVREGGPPVLPEGPPIPVIVFLSGSRRGTTLRLGGERLAIGTDSTCEIRIPEDTEPLPLPLHAILGRRGDTFELTVSPGAEVWVNGERVEHLVLASGDVLEIGRDGAVLRFRVYPPGSEPFKSLPEVFADSHVYTLASRTSRRFRAVVVLAFALLTTATVVLARRSARLEESLLSGIQAVEGLSNLVAGAQSQLMQSEELGELVTQLRTTSARVDSLELVNSANTRVIAAAAQATLFIQGSYQFVEPVSRRPLRMFLRPDGEPVRSPFGHPALGLEGDGPPLEIFVTGTGFVTTPEGFALTNRHVAFPWEFDDAAAGILAAGFEAEWIRFVGYLPDGNGPLDLEVVLASDEADLAVVQGQFLGPEVPFVRLAERLPLAGDAVLVLGYPLGLRALMARSDADFVARLMSEGVEDFFEQAERLSAAGFMQPLATRGIVGQATAASLVYDAETTSGGSGGPVLTLQGEVAAVNTAILPEFGGSNLGVPAARARALLDRARGN